MLKLNLGKSYPPKPCGHCQSLYIQRTKNQRWCSTCSRGKLTYPHPTMSGFYVYGWYKDGNSLPYYVGKGTKQRAWRNGKLKTNIEVRLYRYDLTEEGAYLVEDVLIALFISLGAPLSNLARSRRRREKPPLSIT